LESIPLELEIVALAVTLYVRFGTTIPWPWYTVIGALVTVIVGALASAINAPRPAGAAADLP